MSDSRPVLEAIRELLKFKNYATITEIARISGLSQKEVLSRLNKNGTMVWRNRQNGRITKVDPKSVLLEMLRNNGNFYWKTTHDYGSTTGLDFKGHDHI